eukprot:6172266-Pleurochrysis_carterae.AAC.5
MACARACLEALGRVERVLLVLEDEEDDVAANATVATDVAKGHACGGCRGRREGEGEETAGV